MAHLEKGLIEIYTGPAKGKSTASFGLALRASGHGYQVRIVQFMKAGNYGENRAFEKLAPDVQIASYGRKCFLDPDNPHEEDIALAHEALKKAEQWMLAEDTDIMILDEINNALFFKLLTIEEVLAFVDQKPKHMELVMTGRNAPEELQARADYVTEMREIKHPYTTSGQGSRKGIEF